MLLWQIPETMDSSQPYAKQLHSSKLYAKKSLAPPAMQMTCLIVALLLAVSVLPANANRKQEQLTGSRGLETT